MFLKTKVLIFFTVLLLLIFFEWLFFNEFRNKVFKEEMSERGGLLIRAFAQLSREPLLTLQITRLEKQLDSLLDEKDVLSAQIYTVDYKILAATDRKKEGWSYSGELVTQTELLFEKDIMTARSPIIILDKLWGMAEIIFSLNNMNLKIIQTQKIFIFIFITEFILAISFAIFIQIQLVRPLSRLAVEVKKITPDFLDAPLTQLPLTTPEITMVRVSIDNMRKKLKQAQEDIVAKTQLATMGQIAANMAHEIRNPLEAISGAVEILSAEGYLTENHGEYLSIIKDEIQNLNNYLSMFLEFARSEPVCIKKVQINKLLKDCFFLLNPLFVKKGIKVKFKLKENLSLCAVDINQIKRVIVNVFLNAIEAKDKKSVIWVSTMEKDNKVTIIIRDNGHGIKKEHLPYIFDLYFTTKKSGSGIGLALSKKIVEHHRGGIYIDSLYKKGTSVIIQFPIIVKDK